MDPLARRTRRNMQENFPGPVRISPDIFVPTFARAAL